MRKPPAYFEEIAEKARAEQRFTDEAAAWNAASGASMGHRRAEQYEEFAAMAERKAALAMLETAGVHAELAKTLLRKLDEIHYACFQQIR